MDFGCTVAGPSIGTNPTDQHRSDVEGLQESRWVITFAIIVASFDFDAKEQMQSGHQ